MISYKEARIIKDYLKHGDNEGLKKYVDGEAQKNYLEKARRAIKSLSKSCDYGGTYFHTYDGRLAIMDTYRMYLLKSEEVLTPSIEGMMFKECDAINKLGFVRNFDTFEKNCTNFIQEEQMEPDDEEKNTTVVHYASDKDLICKFNKKYLDEARAVLGTDSQIAYRLNSGVPCFVLSNERGKALVMGLRKNN